MSKVKREVIKMIRSMPDDSSVADIMAELYFRQKVDSGLRQLDEGKGLSHDQVRKRLGKWLD